MSQITKGALVNQFKQTEVPSIFACGNVLHVNDLVDHVSSESEEAGRYAALYAAGKLAEGREISVVPGDGVRYVCPQKIITGGDEDVTLYFRTVIPGRNSVMEAEAEGQVLAKRKAICTSPGTMEQLTLTAEQIKDLTGNVTVKASHEEELA